MKNKYPIMKMHGSGNDFVFYVDFEEKTTPAQVRRICEFHTGVGADGVITVTRSRVKEAKYRMKYFNADGSMAEMCGNGIRCFAKYLLDTGLVVKKGPLKVDTDAGIIIPEVLKNSKTEAMVKVNMGVPLPYNAKQVSVMPDKKGLVNIKFSSKQAKDKAMKSLKGTFMNMGNPHAIFFVKKGLAENFAKEYGSQIEHMTNLFPQKINVEFVEINNKRDLTVHVWERGAGLTLACGTGACATLAAAVLNGVSDKNAKVRLPGGTLEISWKGGDEPIYMTGPARNVYQIYDLENLLNRN